MNPSDKQPARPRCGGWPTYREWAEHDFRRHTAADDRPRGRTVIPLGQVLTELTPITIAEEIETRVACAVFPAPAEPPVIEELATLVRPYVRAGGRVSAGHALEIETVLTATGLHQTALELSDDQLVICVNCEKPRSVAEIASAVNAPIGVAKVLIGDAIDQGLLMLHEMTPCLEGRPPLDLLRRVHAGIAKLA
ncbi:DUF742 domain-containing protein [Amycolatopsis sp. NPDC059657]|uniref:DUF742 domain-containing protein n=1 Tax=Amycolatopsis sp. NPDC059657 TaxID=3346899 RepID=UPI00366D09D3